MAGLQMIHAKEILIYNARYAKSIVVIFAISLLFSQ